MTEILKYVTGVVAGLTAIIQLGKKAFEYQEQFYIRKKLNRYSYLLRCCDKGGKETVFIEMIRRDENLKIATGINTNYEKYQMIMQIYALELFTIAQIRKVHTYFDVVDGKVKGHFGFAEIVFVVWSGLMVFVLTLHFAVTTYLAQTKNDINSLLVLLASIMVYLLLMFGLGEPIRSAVFYRKFKKVLIANGMWDVERGKAVELTI